MKILFLIFCLGLLPNSIQAQSKALEALQRKYKGSEESLSLHVNGHLLRLLLWFDGNEQDAEVKEMVKGVKHVRVLKLPNNQRSMNLQEFKSLKSDIRKESFDELMTFRSDDSNVDILIKEKNDTISELLLLVNDNDHFVVMALRGKIDLDKVFKIAGKVKDI
jgi:hypothetical protein